MIKILFVCLGNICRSPMAEFAMKDLVRREGVADAFRIDSAATSTEELGNPVYPPARRKLAQQGISCDGKTARQIEKADYDRYDYIIGMDRNNLRCIRTMAPQEDCCVMGMLLDYDKGGEVADPWYTGDFEKAYRDVVRGCRGLLDTIVKRNGWQ